ncbi:hypothetical protein BGZ57DRAFT_931960 [Hyaloscypha finlandica]|nr:hypothetical protein BGZ57DRAFT_931960 [Hyaloscypha finlandica]
MSKFNTLRSHTLSMTVLLVIFCLLALQFSWCGNHEIPKASSNTPTSPRHKVRIAILTFTTKPTSNTNIPLTSKCRYAQERRYDITIDFKSRDTLRGVSWHKFLIIEESIVSSKYDWVWYIQCGKKLLKLLKLLKSSLE